jgi:hypothetical protein
MLSWMRKRVLVHVHDVIGFVANLTPRTRADHAEPFAELPFHYCIFLRGYPNTSRPLHKRKGVERCEGERCIRICYGSTMRKSADNLNLTVVIVFDGANVAPHSRSRGALRGEAGRADRDTEVGNPAIGNIIHESCAGGGSDEGGWNVGREARTMDEHGLEGSALAASSLTSSGAAAALLFQVESLPMLAGPRQYRRSTTRMGDIHTTCMTGSLAMFETDSLTFSSTRARYPGASNSGSVVRLFARLASLSLTISELETNVSEPITDGQQGRAHWFEVWKICLIGSIQFCKASSA